MMQNKFNFLLVNVLELFSDGAGSSFYWLLFFFPPLLSSSFTLRALSWLSSTTDVLYGHAIWNDSVVESWDAI